MRFICLLYKLSQDDGKLHENADFYLQFYTRKRDILDNDC